MGKGTVVIGIAIVVAVFAGSWAANSGSPAELGRFANPERSVDSFDPATPGYQAEFKVLNPSETALMLGSVPGEPWIIVSDPALLGQQNEQIDDVQYRYENSKIDQSDDDDDDDDDHKDDDHDKKKEEKKKKEKKKKEKKEKEKREKRL